MRQRVGSHWRQNGSAAPRILFRACFSATHTNFPKKIGCVLCFFPLPSPPLIHSASPPTHLASSGVQCCPHSIWTKGRSVQECRRVVQTSELDTSTKPLAEWRHASYPHNDIVTLTMMRRNFASLDLRALDGANASPVQLPASDPHEHLAQLRLEDEELHGVGCPLECLVAAPASAPTPMTTPVPQPRKETPLKTLTPTVLRPSPPIPMNTLRSSQPHHANGSASYCCAASAKRCWKCESHGSSPAALVSASYGSAIFQHDPVEALSLGVTSDRLASSPCVPMTRPSIPRNVVQSV